LTQRGQAVRRRRVLRCGGGLRHTDSGARAGCGVPFSRDRFGPACRAESCSRPRGASNPQELPRDPCLQGHLNAARARPGRHSEPFPARIRPRHVRPRRPERNHPCAATRPVGLRRHKPHAAAGARTPPTRTRSLRGRRRSWRRWNCADRRVGSIDARRGSEGCGDRRVRRKDEFGSGM